MNSTSTLFATFAFLAFSALADEPFVPSFADVPSVEAARIHLHAVGVEAFFDEARKANVAPPRIHSKYWVDTLPNEEQEKRRLEYAYRDFGLEVARQLGDKAIDIYDHPDPAAETNRLDWLLGVAEWLRLPGGYGNFRISQRIEGIAGVVLARVTTDFSVPNDEIESYFSRFLSEEQKAVVRADILFEESRGELDVRDMASRFSNKGNFEVPWRMGLRTAHRHFGSMECLFKYGQYRDRINAEKTKYSFFCEDEELPRVRSVVNTWDFKQHFSTCIYGGGLISMNPIRSLYLFRKVVGEFPCISKDRIHNISDSFDLIWWTKVERHGRGGFGAGICYDLVIHNNLMDFETHEIDTNR